MPRDRDYFHLISTGTSLLNNFVRYSERYKKFKTIIDKYRMHNWGVLSVDDPLQSKVESYIPSNNEVHIALRNFLDIDPKRHSAELNSFLRFIDREGQTREDIEIAIYSTDTGNCRLAAQIIYEYLKDTGFYIVGEPIRIRDFSYGPEYFDDALIEIMDKVVSLIHRKTEQGYEVFINATPGFKAETTFISIASMLALKRPPTIYYIHESLREPVKLPAIPLDIRRVYRNILAKYIEPRPYSEVFRELLDEGLNLDELIENGLMVEHKGLVRTRTWLTKLIEMFGGD